MVVGTTKRLPNLLHTPTKAFRKVCPQHDTLHAYYVYAIGDGLQGKQWLLRHELTLAYFGKPKAKKTPV